MEDLIIDLKDNPIIYWEFSDTCFKKNALKYLSIPVTAMPSERLFTKSWQLISAKRSTLKPKNITQLLFICSNFKILEISQ